MGSEVHDATTSPVRPGSEPQRREGRHEIISRAVSVVSPRRLVWLFHWVVLLLTPLYALLFLLAAIWEPGPWHWPGLALVIVVQVVTSLLAAAQHARVRRARQPRPGMLVLDGRMLSVLTEHPARFRLADPPSGWAFEHEGRPHVALLTQGGQIACAALASRAGVRAVLRAAGVECVERRTRYGIGRSRRQALGLGVVLGGGTALLAALAVGVAAASGVRDALVVYAYCATLAATGAVLAAVRALAGRCTVELGRDGVLLRDLFARRFIPYTAIRSVSLTSGVTVELADGTELVWEVLTPSGTAAWLEPDPLVRAVYDAETRAIAEAIRAACAQPRAWAGGARTRLGFRRGERSVQQWREHLRQLARSGYRLGGFDTDVACALLEDGVAPHDERIGAALALWESGKPELRQRVRVAVGCLADKPVQKALEALMDERLDETHVQALERVLAPPGHAGPT